MATSKEFLNFVLEQLSDLQNITYRSMMGSILFITTKKLRLIFATTSNTAFEKNNGVQTKLFALSAPLERFLF